jgi:hypothetical protein
VTILLHITDAERYAITHSDLFSSFPHSRARVELGLVGPSTMVGQEITRRNSTTGGLSTGMGDRISTPGPSGIEIMIRAAHHK